MKKQLLPILIASCFTASAWTLDWDKVQYWAGEGENKAALVVEFSDDGDQYGYVWGYRWPAGTTATGEDMFRAIASASEDLDLFTQYTGDMGSTVCGIGYSADHSVMRDLAFDFDGAQADGNISFNYFSANGAMGQTQVPGFDTPDICAQAIEDACDTHILEHPINARAYGYPAYDYDWWLAPQKSDLDSRWQAGWYNGYWSYYTGKANSESLAYSGTGYSSRQLADGDVDAWKYRHLTDDADGYTGASTPSAPLNYHHFGEPADDPIPDGIVDAVDDEPVILYRLDRVIIVKKQGKIYKQIIN